MRELLKQRGFVMKIVEKAIGVGENTMYRWTDTAPIDKLFRISKFTGIPFDEIADCYNPDLHPQDETEPDRN